MPWSMFNGNGQRKYLTRSETDMFVKNAKTRNPDVQGFCLLIAATGCRISEALALTRNNIDFEAGTVIIRCLKKRGRRVFRAIPLPSTLLQRLRQWIAKGALGHERLFPWSRMTGYRRICEVMSAAGIKGDYATPKGLRHAFGINAIQSGVPLNLVQRWLGHADIKTTAIYTSAMGDEERTIAERMWNKRSRRRLKDAETPIPSERDVVLSVAQDGGAGHARAPAGNVTSRPTAPFSGLFPDLSCHLRQFWLNCRNNYHCSSMDYPFVPTQSLWDGPAGRSSTRRYTPVTDMMQVYWPVGADFGPYIQPLPLHNLRMTGPE